MEKSECLKITLQGPQDIGKTIAFNWLISKLRNIGYNIEKTTDEDFETIYIVPTQGGRGAMLEDTK